MTSVLSVFEAALEQGVEVPASLQPLLSSSTSTTPWKLAERAVRSLLADAAHEQQLAALLGSIKAATGESANFAEGALGIVDDAMSLLHTVLKTRSLNTLFDKTTALPTIYFFVAFLMRCAGVDPSVLSKHEATVVRAAAMASRLLQNKQVYENAFRAFVRKLFKKCLEAE